jgi:hypothetical protein
MSDTLAIALLFWLLGAAVVGIVWAAIGLAFTGKRSSNKQATGDACRKN